MGLFDILKNKSNVQKQTEQIETNVQNEINSVQNETYSVQNIYLDDNNFGYIHLFNLLPQKAKDWHQGPVFWHFNISDIDKLCKIKQGEEIGTLEISFIKREDAVTGIVEEKILYHIIPNVEGFISLNGSSFNYKGEKTGRLNVDNAFFLENNKNDKSVNPFLFLFTSCVSDIVNKEFSYSIDIDPIVKDSIIKFKDNHYAVLTPSIDYRMEGNKSFAFLVLQVRPYMGTIKLLQSLIFLFDSGDICTYAIDKKLTSYIYSGRMDTKFKLSQEQLYIFTTQKIKMVRYSFSNEGSADMPIENIYVEYFQSYSAIFAKALKECGWESKQKIEQQEGTKSELKDSICYVYLMYDEANGFYKIGISNKPKYREHTLQSEKPTIVLIKAKEFPIRPIAEAFEVALHKTYESKRIRGEWFKLDQNDVDALIKSLS